jgi:AraC family transcriptional regulator
MLQTISVFDTLSASTRAERLEVLDLGEGRASAIWRNSHDRMRYERPDGHTFSCYLQGGAGTRRLDAGSIAGWPGALCLMPQGASSEWEITDQFEFVHLYVSDVELRRLFAETFDRDARLMQLPEATFASVPSLSEALVEVARATISGDLLRADAAIAEAVGQLFANPHYGGQSSIALKGGLSPNIRRRLLDFIEASLADSISLRDLGCVAGLSEFHLQRMFRMTCGVSPHVFILNRRIARAKRMLAGSDPIAQIAPACGFSSQSHLNRMFKAITGATPMAWRRALTASR